MTEPVDLQRMLPPPQRFVAKSKMQTVARAEIKRYIDDVIAPAVAQAVGELISESEARFTAKLAALEDRMAEFAFKGAWAEGRQYKRDNFVTLGSVWHANNDTTSRPGTDSDWSLAVPKPRDGRDGKDMTPPEPPERRTTRSQR